MFEPEDPQDQARWLVAALLLVLLFLWHVLKMPPL
jgi:hypothetical protein